ncbi:DNA polymerase III subunit alpha [Kocuria rhizophila]|uniref:Error-prone DNA polymerase n=1 Tax=Kocuria rhizophila (strain ATCC 9341 / DSM 348 / NBRC 103217 / DC2201) TaxID=378753 RepID=B2GGG3_KOCRD|nr:DNA polymerase III subunit alpha [Kocuria rhizophila]ASE10597.1 DNA polymerase III subunit alpha [Kocuria rhizophila]BAG29503.1 error-prone DNA polymerase [Kocuria rhizophila DC2201]VEH75218.1 DNA polymerase III subunit alpha [Kocuria rhizophila]
MWFPHLHVASAFSAHYGVARPEELARAAAGQGAEILACTDRDGLYGAVKHVLACQEHGIAPVLGVDLALLREPVQHAGAPGGARPRAGSTPQRGGAVRPGGNPVPARGNGSGPGSGSAGPVRPGSAAARGGRRTAAPRVVGRVVVLATGHDGGSGYAALCRLVSAAHRSHDRAAASPIGLTAAQLARHVHRAARSGEPGLVVLVGPDSDAGRLLARRHYRGAREALNRWRARLPPGALVVETTTHLAPQGEALSTGHAVRLYELGRAADVPVVLSNAVRYAHPGQAVTADVLDAARTLMSLDELAGADRGVLQPNGQGWLKDGPRMERLAHEIVTAARVDRDTPARLLVDTHHLAERCRLDPQGDLGIGTPVIPEASVLGLSGDPDRELARRCYAGLARLHAGEDWDRTVPGLNRESLRERLERELSVISQLGFAGYFLTVGEVSDLMSAMDVRHAARGSGVSSLVVHLLGISPADPLEYDLVFERFLSPLRPNLPDIDIDMESARRHDVYRRIFERFGPRRVTLMSMQNAYRSRGAVRDAGLALGLGPQDVDHVAGQLWRVPGGTLREEISRRPELAPLAQRLRDNRQMDLLVDLTERLDRLPRHISMHPCGVILSDTTLLDRTPVQASGIGLPMSQYDKHDMDPMGLIKLDILGVRMQSTLAHAVAEVARLHPHEALPDLDTMPRDDPDTFRLISSTHTLGCFQIESPGQRELIGTMGPEEFNDLVVDISLFRPGPMQANMVRPYLDARHGWSTPVYPHPDLEEILAETRGVAVYHEQIMRIMDRMTGCGLGRADVWRRLLGSPGEEPVETAFREGARARGYTRAVIDTVWEILHAFGSFGFCKAHGVAFAVPTYQSAWLKTHHPEAFMAGVWEHDPGMYPARLLVGEARRMGIPVLGPDVNRSGEHHRVEAVTPRPGTVVSGDLDAGIPHTQDGAWGIRMSLSAITGISSAEIERLLAGQPYENLAAVRARARPSRRSLQRLATAGALDGLLHGSGTRASRADMVHFLTDRAQLPARGSAGRTGPGQGQLALPLGDVDLTSLPARLPELTPQERVRAEMETMDIEVSAHLMDSHAELVRAYRATRAQDLLGLRSGSEVVVAGVRVSTMTPPMRSGRRVVFISLDDGSGAVDCTFFDEAQAASGEVLFAPTLLLVHGHTRRTGPRGIGIQAVRAWDLSRPETLPDPRTLLGSCPTPSRPPRRDGPARARQPRGQGSGPRATTQQAFGHGAGVR